MRPTFLPGEIFLEQLCLSLFQGKLCGLLCFGTFLEATDTAGTFTPNAEPRVKLAHKTHAHRSSSVDARLDFGASSAMYRERNTSRNNMPFPLVFITSFLQTLGELQDPSGTSAHRRDFLLGKVHSGAWPEAPLQPVTQAKDDKVWVAVDWDELGYGGMTVCIYHLFLLNEGDGNMFSYIWAPSQTQILPCYCICIIKYRNNVDMFYPGWHNGF